MPDTEAPYSRLSPDAVIAAIEATGELSDGRVLALGSYENRVYQVGREDAEPLVVKFYRPGRWPDAAILEEHAFALELAAAGIPLVAPLAYAGHTLLEHDGFRYALFPRRGGRWPELGNAQEREWMGRFMGRMHRVGQVRRFQHRPQLNIETFGFDACEAVLDSEFVPDYLEVRYDETTQALLESIAAEFDLQQPLTQLRIHGDCHRNNVLWTDAGPHFVDLDDCMTGPAIQDLWMLLAGSREEMAAQMRDLLEGYEQFAEFDRVQLRLIEPLRTLRMIHYSAWLARRWHDPAFPRAFPWFAEPTYWERHVGELQEQLAAMELGALQL